MFSLQFEPEKVPYWAGRYHYKVRITEAITTEVAPQIRDAGYYTKENFLKVCKWKSDRPERFYKQNSEELIQTVTQAAFSTSCEQFRIEVLKLLKGVNFPVASALLHFGSSISYPILDMRALWSLGIRDQPKSYNFEFWWEYTLYCRQLSKDLGISIRMLDLALWQYSKENQV